MIRQRLSELALEDGGYRVSTAVAELDRVPDVDKGADVDTSRVKLPPPGVAATVPVAELLADSPELLAAYEDPSTLERDWQAELFAPSAQCAFAAPSASSVPVSPQLAGVGTGSRDGALDGYEQARAYHATPTVGATAAPSASSVPVSPRLAGVGIGSRDGALDGYGQVRAS